MDALYIVMQASDLTYMMHCRMPFQIADWYDLSEGKRRLSLSLPPGSTLLREGLL